MRELLRQDIDWEEVIKLALYHMIMPLVYLELKNNYAHLVPGVVLEQLRQHFADISKYNVHLTGRLINLLTLFEAKGIAAVPFKGPVLAQSLYGNIAFRQFSDLDLLIHKRDVCKTRALLLAEGFKPQFQLTPRQQSKFIKIRNEDQFFRDDGTTVDLHWALIPRYFATQFDLDYLRDRLKSTKLADKEMPTLSTEDMLLFLCIHASKHGWDRLSLIRDVALLIHSDQSIDWSRAIRQAKAQRCERMLFLALYQAKDLFRIELPGEVAESMQQDSALNSLVERIYIRFLSDVDSSPHFFENQLFPLRAMDRSWDKFRYSFDALLTPTPLEWQLISLPRGFSPLYYLIRPMRLIAKHTLASLKYFSGRKYSPSN